MHSYHGPNSNRHDLEDEDDKDCLFQEAKENNNNNNCTDKKPPIASQKIIKARSFSTDLTSKENTQTRVTNYRTPRKSFGDNQLKTLPPSGPTAIGLKGRSNSSAKDKIKQFEQNKNFDNLDNSDIVKAHHNNSVNNTKKKSGYENVGEKDLKTSPKPAGVGVQALINKIQTKNDDSDVDLYQVKKFELAKQKFGLSKSRDKLSVANSGSGNNLSLRTRNNSYDGPIRHSFIKDDFTNNFHQNNNNSCTGNLLSDSDLNDDPLYRDESFDKNSPNISSHTRIAGMTQNREGRAFLSRKNSFNTKKEAIEANRMTDTEKDNISKDQLSLTSSNADIKYRDDSSHEDRPKPGSAKVGRSTSRVKQIAMSLHERETNIRKTEQMIANHQPLAENVSGHNVAIHNQDNKSEHNSMGFPSPTNRRKIANVEAKAADDSFIKELLEIARAESQEKQNKTEITFAPNLLKTITRSNHDVSESGEFSNDPYYSSSSAQHGLKSPSQSSSSSRFSNTKNSIAQALHANPNTNNNNNKNLNNLNDINSMLNNFSMKNERRGSFKYLDSDDNHLGSENDLAAKPKDFKEAISIASNRLIRKKNSLDIEHLEDGDHWLCG